MTKKTQDRFRQVVRRDLALARSEPAARKGRQVGRGTAALLRVVTVVTLLGGSSGSVSAQAPYRQEVLPGFSSLDADSSSPDLVDLDGDGDLDVVVGEVHGTLRYFSNIGNSLAPTFVEATGSANPFTGIEAGYDSSPDLVDLDGDGDLDAVVGDFYGTLRYFENVGSSVAPAFVEATGSANPFSGIDVEFDSSPDLVDLDGDGDLDAVVGESYGALRYFANTGSSVAPAFVEAIEGANPFSGIGGIRYSSPALVDVDGDDDFDAVVGGLSGALRYFTNTGNSAAPAFVEAIGNANPFSGTDEIRHSSPALVDVDGDGDLDAVVGESYGALRYFANTGNSVAPAFAAATGRANPFSGVDVGANSTLALADLDGDDDFDAVVGGRSGTLRYFANTGNSVAPAFVEAIGSANPFGETDGNLHSSPEFADLDGDGDLDAVVGEFHGLLRYFANTGTSSAPAFAEATGSANPLSGIDVRFRSSPELVDLDGDGDLDAVMGHHYGTLRYFANTGNSFAPAFVESAESENPFTGIDVRHDSSPALVDFDGDGDLDAVVGETFGTLRYFANTGSSVAPAFVEVVGSENPFTGIDVGRDSSPALVDVDGDGDLDALVGEDGGRVVFLRSLAAPPAPCVPDATTLCLDDEPGDSRFEVRLAFDTVQAGGLSGDGKAIALSSLGVTRGGLFHFGNPANPEILVKVLDGCTLNDHHWVFHAAGTNLGFTVRVRDSVTDDIVTHTNPDLTAAAPVQDAVAFRCADGLAGDSASWVVTPGLGAPAAASTAATTGEGCVPGDHTLCIDDRFRIDVAYQSVQGGGISGMARSIPLTSVAVARGGLFYFHNPTNPEMLIKVLDGCAVNDHYWVFYSAATNVGLTVAVTDTATGASQEYENPDLVAASPVQDVVALPCE